MALPTHGKLVCILDQQLELVEHNNCCSEPILVEHIVAVEVHVLSGGRTKDQHHIIGSSLDATYKTVNDFIDAVNAALDPKAKNNGMQSMLDLR